jgi:hypothetical protein
VSGNYQNWNAESGVPGGIAETAAAVAAGLNEAMAALQASQAQGHSFFTSYGDAVSAGHPDTNAAPVEADRG